MMRSTNPELLIDVSIFSFANSETRSGGAAMKPQRKLAERVFAKEPTAMTLFS